MWVIARLAAFGNHLMFLWKNLPLVQATLLCLEAWAGEFRRESANRTQPHNAGDGGTPGKVIAFHELHLSMSSLPPSFLPTPLKTFPFHLELCFFFVCVCDLQYPLFHPLAP